MADASIDTAQSSLLEAPTETATPQTPAIVQVAKEYGVSPVRQMRDIMGLRFGARKMSGAEYYSLRLFDPARADKASFTGQNGINALNASMNPPMAVPTRAFVGNKLLYTELLAKLGIATSHTQALVSTFRTLGTLPVLKDAQTLVDFLRNDAKYPLFGKPHHGSLSEGSVRINGTDGDELLMANGRRIGVEQFAKDVFAQYPGGFMIQTALDPHADMAHIAGPAVGCVRVVTVNDGTGAKPAYALWKMPAPDAMSDNFWQHGSLLAMLDLASGTVTTCNRGAGLETETFDDHPVSGVAVVGQTLPFWAETLQMATDAHAVFPEFGVCGFDIAVTADGPKVLECNDNPSHMLYQLASGKGVNNADLAPVWAAVATRQTKQLARLKGK
ncbi:sugar-transfer associated ATP-grasp domain-containing protein [Ascidiaceihabitans sp.]|uniref:sugar-transfer associated ATP-grasp domain-containing protein n=1 Tax=Ascidiaceihabitans sp. TaxID=1872644 RepID=UPI00329704E1